MLNFKVLSFKSLLHIHSLFRTIPMGPLHCNITNCTFTTKSLLCKGRKNISLSIALTGIVEQATRRELIYSCVLFSIHSSKLNITYLQNYLLFKLTLVWYSNASSSPWLNTHFLLRFYRRSKQGKNKKKGKHYSIIKTKQKNTQTYLNYK